MSGAACPRKSSCPWAFRCLWRILKGKTSRRCARGWGLQKQGKYLLVMGGSMGAGNLPELVRAIQGECQRQSTEATIFVVCGSNRRLFSALLEAFRDDPAVRVKSYLENIADYMKACDLLFTKPGGLTTTESAVTRIPHRAA